MRYSIRTRLTAAFIGLAIGPLLLVGGVLAWQSFAVQEQQALDMQHEVARRVAAQVMAFFEELESDLYLVSQVQGLQTLEQDEQYNVLSRLLSQRDIFDKLVLLDNAGDEQIYLSRVGLPPVVLGNRAKADEFIIPSTSGDIYYSPVWFDETTGEPLMTIALPLFDLRTGVVEEVLVAEARVKNVWDIIAGTRLSQGQSVYIVDAEGRVVAHRNPSVVLRGTTFDLPNQGGIQFGLAGSHVVLATETVRFGQQEFHIVAERATSEALALAVNTILITVILVLAALAVSNTLGFLAVRQIVHPIQTVAKTAQAISSGDLSQQVEVASRDEIGDLAGAFNHMTVQLRQMLAQVQEQAHRVQRIVDTVPEGVILLDPDLRVLLANPLGKKDLVALASAQVGDVLTHLGDRPIEELLTSPPKGLWHEVATEHRSFQVFARSIENGPTSKGWVLVVRDVTQQREVERRIQQQERLSTVGQLAAGMAHDLNNIMAVVTLYAGLSLRAPDLHEEVRERLQTISEQAYRASRLIQQILDFSRHAVLERGPLDLAAFLKEQIELLQRTLPEHIQIDMAYDKDEYVVNADPTRIQQVVMNLATNARDAMPKGGRLHFVLERIAFGERDTPPLLEMKPGRWIRLTVADTGIGILPEMQPRVFDPFFTTKEPGKGSGLGLAQVYGIVKQHEGHIDFTTEPGRGTTFILYLPALSAPQPPVTAVESEPLPQGQGQTILVVEDGAATRRALVESLAALNYRILEATNGQQALKVFEQHAGAIDLVLSDVVMPEMGGKALLYALQERDPAVRVVLLTGHPLDEQELEDLHASGLRSWILKPLGLEQLARVVAEALSPASP